MKKFFVVMLVWVAISSCTTKGGKAFYIDGVVEHVTLGTVYLQRYENKMFFVLDSARIKDSKFHFSTNLKLPEIYGITLDTTKVSSFLLFLDNNSIKIKLDTANHFSNTEVTGSEAQDLFVAYKKQSNVKIDEFIKQHPKSYVALYAFYREHLFRLTPEEIRSNIQLLDSSLLNTSYVKKLEEVASVAERIAIGKPAPDFVAKDPEGNLVRFHDHLGKGYILLDFWAAWCGPCRRENPNVVQVYNKYKNKGFAVYGVSLDRSKEDWIKAIETDSLTWTHVSDLLHWDSESAQLYGVRGIPGNFVIDKDGIIVAKNVRGGALDTLINQLTK
jgi:peroxiredoxin